MVRLWHTYPWRVRVRCLRWGRRGEVVWWQQADEGAYDWRGSIDVEQANACAGENRHVVATGGRAHNCEGGIDHKNVPEIIGVR